MLTFSIHRTLIIFFLFSTTTLFGQNINPVSTGSIPNVAFVEAVDVFEEYLFFSDYQRNKIVKLDLIKNDNRLQLEFNMEFGKKGHGPGEYVVVKSVKVFKEEIYIADSKQSKILVFDLEGNFQRYVDTKTHKIIPGYIQPSKNGIMIMSARYLENGIFVWLDNNSQLHTIDSQINNEDHRYAAMFQSTMTSFNENIVISYRYFNKIEVFDNRNKIRTFELDSNLKHELKVNKRFFSDSIELDASETNTVSTGIGASDKYLVVSNSVSPYQNSNELYIFDKDLELIKHIKGLESFWKFAVYDNFVLTFVMPSTKNQNNDWKYLVYNIDQL